MERWGGIYSVHGAGQRPKNLQAPILKKVNADTGKGKKGNCEGGSGKEGRAHGEDGYPRSRRVYMRTKVWGVILRG